jgi:tetratricopeptide (TPR) repeat protein
VYLPDQPLMRYGVLALAGLGVVLMVGGAVYLFDRSDTAKPAATAQGTTPPAAAKPRVAAKPTADPDEPSALSSADSERIAQLLGEARRLAQDGKFAEAKAVLDKVDASRPRLAETAQARREIDQMSTPQSQLALQLERARSAIEQDDRAAAEKALAEAERLNPQAPELAALRQALQDAQQKEARRASRIAELLTEMREAIARRDFAAADRALNEATRLNVRDPAIDPARVELARAQDSDRKKDAKQ